MVARDNSILARALFKLADAVLARPSWFVWPQIALFVVAVWFTVARLTFNLDRNALVGSDQPYHRNFLALKEEFTDQDDIVCVVESDDLEKNRQFVERLGRRLEAESTLANPTNLFTDVFYKGDMKMLGKKALLFVPGTNLVELQTKLADYRPFIDQFAGASNLAGLFTRINAMIRHSGRETNAQTDSLLGAIPALERIVRRATGSLGLIGPPPSPGVDALFGAGDEAEREKYITFAKGRIYLVTAKARAEDLNDDAVDRFRRIVEETRKEAPGVNVGITGEPVLEIDEMRQSQIDSTKASIVSLALCAAIFIIGYRGAERPLKAVLCLVIGLGYTMGYTTLVVGHLNILTITFVPMLIGIAIDYGVHLITRYEEELHRGRSVEHAIRRALGNTGQGVVTGCLTTAGAFFAMALTHFKGIQEMGLITGGGMVICLIPMMTLLPVMLLRGRQNRRDVERAELHPTTWGDEDPFHRRARFERIWLDRPWTVVGSTVAVCAVAALTVQRVRFDYNLLHMQSEGLPSVIFEQKLVRSSEKSVLYGAVVATNIAEAVDLEKRLVALPTVQGVDSMARFLAEPAEPKLRIVREVGDSIQNLRFPAPDPAPVDLVDLHQVLWSERGYMLLAADEIKKAGDTNLLAAVTGLTDAIQELTGRMSTGDEETRKRNARKLGEYQRALFDDLRETFDVLRTQDTSGGLEVKDLPPSLQHRFIGRTGKQLLQVYPKEDVWDRVPQEAFVKELQSVAPKATGTPVQLYYYTELLRASYVTAAWWALGAIIVLVLAQFRRPGSVVLALLPVGVGTLWVGGYMGWTGVAFNPANIMMLPLVIGIGVTNGIHILTRVAEEKHAAVLGKSTGKAVLVSGLNTMAGFGSLILADHRGIRSLGAIMTAGTAACMIAGLTLLPAVLTLISRKSTPSAPGSK
jgi:uncharacterized protein